MGPSQRASILRNAPSCSAMLAPWTRVGKTPPMRHGNQLRGRGPAQAPNQQPHQHLNNATGYQTPIAAASYSYS